MSHLRVEILKESGPRSTLGRLWDALAGRNPASGFMQSTTWADFKRRQGYRILHLGLLDDQALVGGAVCFAAPDAARPGFLVAPEGPVLPWENEALSTEGLRLLVETVQKLSLQYNAMAFRIEPRLSPPRLRGMRSFGRAPIDLVPCETLYLNLDLGAEQLLAKMEPKGRYNIRLAQKRGVRVFENSSVNQVPQFYSLLTEAGDRDSFYVEPMSFFSDLCQSLFPSGMARLFFAEHEGDLLGALLLIAFGKRATYLYGGISNQKRSLMAGYLLQWQALQTAIASGCSTYDFYGFVSPHESDHPYARFSRFKRLFGGTPVRFIGAQDHFFIDYLADAVIQAIGELSPDCAADVRAGINSGITTTA